MIGLTPTTSPDLHRLAEQLGVQLVRHSGGQKGWYNPRTRTISTRRGMSIIQYKSTLAHELGHAFYGDVTTGHGWFDTRTEHRADQYAAHLLITPEDFHDAYTWHGGHLPAIADDLEVTHHLLATWLDAERTQPPWAYDSAQVSGPSDTPSLSPRSFATPGVLPTE